MFMHVPMGPHIVDCEVHRAAVVPKGNGARAPPKPAGELGAGRVLIEVPEERRALIDTHMFKALRIDWVDE